MLSLLGTFVRYLPVLDLESAHRLPGLQPGYSVIRSNQRELRFEFLRSSEITDRPMLLDAVGTDSDSIGIGIAGTSETTHCVTENEEPETARPDGVPLELQTMVEAST